MAAARACARDGGAHPRRPAYAGDIEGEMCTPTGAALIRHFATEFGHMPEMTLEAVGCGLGSREYPGAANCCVPSWARAGT